MKKNNVFLILLLAVMFAACSQSDKPVVPPTPPSGTTINYHLATADEARTLMQGNTEHYAIYLLCGIVMWNGSLMTLLKKKD